MVMARRQGFLRTFLREDRGVAAIEFALILPLLCYMTLNVADLSIYVYRRMEVSYAAQMGAQAAWKTCDATLLPATTLCPGLTAAVDAAVAGTALGNAISLVAGSLTEGYYCLNASNALVWVSDVSSKPTSCAAVGMASLQPGDYITLQVTYRHTPLFPGISITGWTTVGGLLNPVVTKTAFMRLG